MRGQHSALPPPYRPAIAEVQVQVLHKVQSLKKENSTSTYKLNQSKTTRLPFLGHLTDTQ